MSQTVEVKGRNGSTYNATHVCRNCYVVGKYIVEVIDGKVTATRCKATKLNLAAYAKLK